MCICLHIHVYDTSNTDINKIKKKVNGVLSSKHTPNHNLWSQKFMYE